MTKINGIDGDGYCNHILQLVVQSSEIRMVHPSCTTRLQGITKTMV